MAITWDPSYKTGSVTLSGGNLVATASAAGHGAGSNTVVNGKGYIEFLCETGRQAVGLIVKDLAGHPADTSAGINIYTDGTTGYFGLYDADPGIGTVSFALGGRVCLAYDVTAQRVWFRVNNGAWNNSGSANPATGVGGLDVGRDMTAANTVLWLYSDQSGAKATINAGASAFTYTPPSGFTGPDAPSGYTLTAAAAAFTETGQAANALFGRKVLAATGAVTLGGRDAVLVHGASGAYTLAADAAAFAYSGRDAGARVGWRLASATAAFLLDGQAAGFIHAPAAAFSLGAAGADFLVNGPPARLDFSGLRVWAPVEPSPGIWSDTQQSLGVWTPVFANPGTWS